MTSPQAENDARRQLPAQESGAEEFAAHYRRAYPHLTVIAAGIVGDIDDAEDIVQQAAGIAIEKNTRFDSPSRFIGWLAGVVRHCALNHRRKSIRRKTFASDPAYLSDVTAIEAGEKNDLPIDDSTGELRVDQNSFGDDLTGALMSLGVDARCCLLLRTVQNLSYAEISQLLEMPQGTVMSHVHRSKQAMRKYLAEHEIPGRT